MELYKRAVTCVDATMGIVSNNPDLIREARYFASPRVESLLTNVHSLPEASFAKTDADFFVIDDPRVQPGIAVGDKACYCSGPFSAWEEACKDIRYSLFGNLGLFFRYTLATLERCHGIFSFHASSLYIPSNNTLLLIIGGPGAGKTVYLLEGVVQGWKVFSTEMTHLRLTEDGYEFYKGSLYDNVRVGSLVYDFPEAIDKLGLAIPPVQNVWGEKIVIDLQPIEAADVYKNPRIQIVNVRIESNRPQADVSVIQDTDKIVWHLYQNASEKISRPWLMYERWPAPGCDTEPLAQQRLASMRRFVERANLLPVKNIFAGVKSCLEGIER